MEQTKIDEIKKLYQEKVKISEIARRLNVSRNNIYYYINEEFRRKALDKAMNWFRSLPLERRRLYYQKRKGYQRKYQHDRYNSDEVFRKKQIDRMKKKSKSKRPIKDVVTEKKL